MSGSYYRDFGVTGQGGEHNIFSSLYKQYWRIGFQSRLYDRLCPEAYYDSLRRAAELVVLAEGETVLDAGCGSGMLLPFLTDSLNKGGTYLGIDLLSAGLRSLKLRAKGLGLSVSTVQADLCRELPLADHSVACVVAHFSVYTVPEVKDRRRVHRELGRVLKPGGLLVSVNPSRSYHAKDIIRASLESLKNRGKPWRIKKFLVYPLTLRLGLKHIERQLQSGLWHGYAPGELRDEVEAAGFAIEQSETVYGGCGDLVVGRKL